MIDELSDGARDDIRSLLNEGRIIQYKHNGEVVVYLRDAETISSAVYHSDILLVKTFDGGNSQFVGKMLLDLETANTEDNNDAN